MQALSSITVSGMCFFLGVKTPKVDHSLIMRNLRLPTAVGVFHPWKPSDSLKTMFVCCFAVSPILTIGCFAKIFKSIVGTISVNVINMLFRHSSSYIEPNNPMCSIVFPVNLKIRVAATVNAPSFIANADFWSGAIPVKESSFRVVAQNRRKFVMRQHAEILPGIGKDCKD